MFEVSVREHFDAAHFLRGYQGKMQGCYESQNRVESYHEFYITTIYLVAHVGD